MSGYGVHSRQVARWIVDKKLEGKISRIETNVLPWGDTPWILKPSNYVLKEIVEGSVDLIEGVKYDVTFQIQLPNEWDPKLGKFNVGVTAAVESTKCNPLWVESCKKMDLIIVPSTFTKQCLLNTASESDRQSLDEKIHVIPESFPDGFESYDTSQRQTSPNERNIIIFGQITGMNPHNDRKNIFNTIKWTSEVMGDIRDKSTNVYVKTNMVRNTKIDRNIASKLMAKLVSEVRKTQNPKFHLIHGHLNNDELIELYTKKNIVASVLLSRGEGFCLPLLEAAALGIPVIATDWSGYKDFLLDDFQKVDYKLSDVHPSKIDGKIFVKGSQWAEASEQKYKEVLSKILADDTEQRKLAESVRERILKEYSFSAVSKIYDDTVGRIFE